MLTLGCLCVSVCTLFDFLVVCFNGSTKRATTNAYVQQLSVLALGKVPSLTLLQKCNVQIIFNTEHKWRVNAVLFGVFCVCLGVYGQTMPVTGCAGIYSSDQGQWFNPSWWWNYWLLQLWFFDIHEQVRMQRQHVKVSKVFQLSTAKPSWDVGVL